MHPLSQLFRFLRGAPLRARPNRTLPSLELLEDRSLPSTLGGFVFNDANNNGVMDSGEAGIATVTVKLTGTDDLNHSVNLTQTTAADGSYSFVGLAAGTYAIQAMPPSGYLNGQGSAGTAGGSAAAGAVSNIAVNGDGTGYNFGELARTAGWTAIQSNFNGTAVPAGDALWFSSVFKANGLGKGPVTLSFVNQTISFVANGAPVTVAVPDATVTFSPAATTAATTFDAATNSWITTLPMQFSGNGFLSGVAYTPPNGLPGGVNPVTWQGQVLSDTAGVSVNWQWATAVYKSFSADYNALNVKPVDDNQASAYKNSDHAGTPEAFTAYVTGGARGGGGSNFTGSLSPTASLSPPVAQTAPASLSGFVFDGNTGAGLAGVTVTLTYTNALGQTVTATAVTAADGSYSFAGLPPGVFTVSASLAPGFTSIDDQVGTVNGAADGASLSGNTLGQINLSAGDASLNYDFLELFGGS